MKVIAVFLIFFIGIALGAVSTGLYASPDHPGKCVIDGQVFEPGTHNNPSDTKCYRIECNKSGFAQMATCGVQVLTPECKSEGFKDASKPYPDCCERKITCS